MQEFEPANLQCAPGFPLKKQATEVACEMLLSDLIGQRCPAQGTL
jgi:hypothetical protein